MSNEADELADAVLAEAPVSAPDPENPFTEFPDPPEVLPDVAADPVGFEPTHELEGADGMAYPLKEQHIGLFADPTGKEWTRAELDARGTLRRVLPR